MKYGLAYFYIIKSKKYPILIYIERYSTVNVEQADLLDLVMFIKLCGIIGSIFL